ncbi:MFS transporter [Candidatus Bathyarchaeota archaeon]|nr:MFS transporter [Candidatus Bathyarchaeota archaeon]
MKMREILEEAPLGGYHYRLLAVAYLGWMFDAMNSGLISFVLKPLSAELGLTPGVVGLLLSSWLMGMLIGAFLMGTLADRIGRKPVIVASLLLYSIPAGLCGLADRWELIAALRFLAGIGASSYMAVTSTLVSECFPRRIRGRAVAFLESAWAFGWLLAAYLGLILAPTRGWRPVILAGFTPLIAAMLFQLLVPESPRFLEKAGRIDEAVSILIKGSLMSSERRGDVEAEEVEEVGFTVASLWAKPYRRRTLMLWIHWFCIVLAYWGIFLWAPYILVTERGLTLVKSLRYSLLITAMQIPGYWSGALLIERVGRKRLLTLYMALAGLGSLMFSMAHTPLEVLIWGSIISFFNLGAWGITYAYTPELYPTGMRATGAGWANSIGRIGGILGPYIAGVLIGWMGSTPLFILFALIHLVSASAVALLGIETRGVSLD